MDSGTLNGTQAPDSLRAARTPERDELTQQLTGGNRFLLPHFRTFSSMYNMASRIYSYRWDEAYRAGRENSNAMLRDAYFRSLLQERLKPLRRWKVDIEAVSHDPNAGKDPEAEQIRQLLLGAYNQTAQSGRQRYYLGMAIWYGRYGSQVRWDRRNINGFPLWCTPEHVPVNGDKIQYGWDGQYGVMVQPQVKNDYPDVRIADAGAPVLMLTRQDIRDRFIIHTYDLEDADYWEADKAGRVAGIGLRDYCYWGWWLRDELIGWLMDFMEKVGSLGILLFFYQEGSAEGKRRAEESARAVGNGNALAVPVPKNDPRAGGVEMIPANTSGSQFLTEMISDWFERHIERLIIGQSMSGGKDSGDGLGGTGRAEFAKDTKFQLLASDAEDLAETLTTDWLKPCQRLNNLGYGKHEFRFVLRVPDPEAKDKLAAVQTATSFGVEFEEDEVRDLTGLQKPRPGVKTIGGQQQGGMPGMGGPGMPPGGDPNNPQGAGGPQQMDPNSGQGEDISAQGMNPGDQGAGGPQQSQGNAPPELVAAMLELAYKGDHDGVQQLAEFGSDPDAVAGLMDDDEPHPQQYGRRGRLVHYNVTDHLGHEHGGDGKFVSKGGVSESSGGGGSGASGSPTSGHEAFDAAAKAFKITLFTGGPRLDQWAEVMSHPEKGMSRYQELQAIHDKDSEEDAPLIEKREQEDDKRQDRRDREDEKRDRKRDKEDAEIEKRHEAELKEIDKKRAELDKIGDAREKAREKEDTSDYKTREKEDKEREKARDKEHAEIEKRRKGEDKELEARHRSEDKLIADIVDRSEEIDASDLDPDSSEYLEAKTKLMEEAKDIVERYGLDPESWPEDLEDAVDKAREAEEDDISERREQEDSELETRWEKEDEEIEAKRQKEEEDILNRRQDEDDAHGELYGNLDDEQSEIESRHEEEISELTDAREQEDSELADAREKEDADIEEARHQEDRPEIEQRKKRDRDLYQRWKAEDDGTANDGGSDGGLLELFSLVSYQWTAAQTKSGKVKAVWQGEGQRRPLYGKQAEAALQRKEKGEADPAPGTPSRTKQMLMDRKAQAEPARAEARQRWAEAIAKGVPHEQLGALAEHLQTLTRDEIREMARGLEKRVGGLKRDLVQRLIDHVKPAETQTTPEKGDDLPLKVYDERQPKKRKGFYQGTGTLASEIQRRGGIDPKDPVFLSHFSGIKEAMEYGISMGIFRKGGTGLDGLAKSLVEEGHINVQEGEDEVEHLVEKLKQKAKSDLVDRTDEYKKAYDEHIQREREAHEAGIEAGDIEEAKRSGEEDAHREVEEDPYGAGGQGDGAGEEKADLDFDFGANVNESSKPAGQTDLFGRKVPESFRSKPAIPRSIDDALREAWTTKAEEWASDNNLKIDKWSASGEFEAGGKRYRVGKAEDGYPIEPVAAPSPASQPAGGPQQKLTPGAGETQSVQPSAGGESPKPQSHIGREFTTPNGAKIKTVELENGQLGFEANGRRIPVGEYKPIDATANADSIKRLQAAGKSPDDYVIMGGALLPKSIADELVQMQDQVSR